MSPEQSSGHRSFVDHRTDVYSLGITLYELLTLRHAFNGKRTEDILRQLAFERPTPIRKVNPSVPEDLETIVEKAYAHSLANRYASAADLVEDLNRFLNAEPISARKPTAKQRFRLWRQRHPKTVTAIVVGVLMSLLMSLGAAGLLYAAYDEEQKQKEFVQLQRDESEGLRLAAVSALQREKDPRLALELAELGTQLHPCLETHQAVMSAADQNHEYANIAFSDYARAAVVISPDGRRVISMASDRLCGKGAFPAEIRDAANGTILHRLDNGDCITSASYDPTGRFIVTSSSMDNRNGAPGSEPLRPVVWEAAGAKRMHSLPDARLVTAHSRMFDNSGEQAVFPAGNDAIIYALQDGAAKVRLRGHTGSVRYAEFSANGKRLLTVADDNTVRIWDSVHAGQTHQFRVRASDDYAARARFGSDSDSLVIADQSGSRLFRLDQAKSEKPVAVREYKYFATCSQRSLAAFFLRGNSKVEIVDLENFNHICDLTVEGGIRSLAFNRLSSQLVVQCQDTIHILDSQSGLT